MNEVGKNFSRNNASGNRKKSDLYETPYSMTCQLLEVEKFKMENVLDPCCGNNAMSGELLKSGLFWNVFAIDKIHGQDFFEWDSITDYLIGNPPYSLAHEFILHAKRITGKKFAFLLPLTYLQGQQRFDEIFQDRKFPLARVHVFIRYPMLGDPLRPDGKYRTGMQTYAWFIWDKSHRGPPQIGWIDNREFVLTAEELTTWSEIQPILAAERARKRDV